MNRTLRIAAAAALSALLLLPPGAAASETGGWFVVSFDGRISGAERDALAASGARALQYVPENSYLTWLEKPTAATAVAGVRGVRELAASEKVDPALRARSGVSVLASALVYAPRASTAVAALGTLGVVGRQSDAQPDAELRQIVLVTAPSRIDQIVALPEVLALGTASPGLAAEDEASSQIQAGNLSGTLPALGYEPWLTSLNLNGSGVRVSITDTGIDETHPDLTGKVVAKVEYGVLPTGGGETEDIGGHGTHVSGIIAGAGANLPALGRAKDAAGFLHGLGVAPGTELVDQNVIGNYSQGGWPPSYGWDKISRDAVRNGAVAFNASWNSLEGTGVGYVQSARTMDAMVRDADWLVDGAEPISLVFSAGNGGGTTSTITAPKEAKNMITVGSSRSSRIGSIDSMSAFTSKGPAKDGRILPTISAPGEEILSSRSRVPGGSCNQPGTSAAAAELFARGFGFYTTCSGTSMATPHVTGAVALITQWWKRSNAGANPSPAMVKALLMNSAKDMGTADIPNKNEGWGRVNLSALFDPNAQRIFVDQSQVLTELDELRTMRVQPADPSKPLKVSLVWTDAPGAGSGGTSKALVNDLDLTVTAADGSFFTGNQFSGGKSAPNGFADRKNNLENVFVAVPGGGPYTIDVRAFNLPGDGVPFAGDQTDQDYALVVSNAVAAE